MNTLTSDNYLGALYAIPFHNEWDAVFARPAPPLLPSEEPSAPHHETEESSVSVIKTEEALPSLGKNLRAFRERAGYTQLALQKLCGVNHNRISNYELDRRVPKASALAKLEPYLHFTPDFYTLVAKTKFARDTHRSGLKALRLAKKLTLVALSKLSGVDFRILSDTERGIYSLKREQAAKLSPHLNATATEILQGINPVQRRHYIKIEKIA